MSDKSRTSTTVWITLIIACLVVVGLFLAPFVYMVARLSVDARRIKRAEAELQKPELYMSVGKTLALHCQSYNGERDLPDHWLPNGLKSLAVGPGLTIVEADRAHVELGGGFHHYGYDLKRDESASSPSTNVWLLYFESEDAPTPEKLLETFSLPSSAKITPSGSI